MSGPPVRFKEKDLSGLVSKSFVWSHFKFTKEDSLREGSMKNVQFNIFNK